MVYTEIADCFENLNRPKRDCWRKDIIAISHNEGLKITIDTNLTTTDFLDVTLIILLENATLIENPTVAFFM